MSKKANPIMVGGFALGGLVIAVVGLIVFGGGKMFEKKYECVAYFEESLSGLDIGAPVEYKGVRVGTVSDVRIIVDREEKSFIRPVTIVLEPARLSFQDGEERGINYDGIDSSVQDGLRAKLATQSMLTGKLKIELSMQPDKEAVFKSKDKTVHEIPTILSPIEAMKEQFGKMNISAIADDIHKITENLSAIVNNEETRNLTLELNNTLRSVQAIMVNADKQLSSVGKDISVMAVNANRLMTNIDGKVTPMSENLDDIATALTPLMKETMVAVARLGGTFDERSTLRVELEDMIDSLAKAAKSFTELTDFIEQHPESLLRGKE